MKNYLSNHPNRRRGVEVAAALIIVALGSACTAASTAQAGSPRTKAATATPRAQKTPTPVAKKSPTASATPDVCVSIPPVGPNAQAFFLSSDQADALLGGNADIQDGIKRVAGNTQDEQVASEVDYDGHTLTENEAKARAAKITNAVASLLHIPADTNADRALPGESGNTDIWVEYPAALNYVCK